MKANVKKLLSRAVEINAKLDAVKVLYRELDEITAALVEAGVKVEKVDGKIVSVIDLFAEKNVIWKQVAAKRYEIKIDSAA